MVSLSHRYVFYETDIQGFSSFSSNPLEVTIEPSTFY